MKTGDWTDGKVEHDKNKRAPHPCSCRFFRYMSVFWEETTYYLIGMLRPAWGMVVWSSCHDHPHLFIISSTVKTFFPWELLITVPSSEPFLFWTFIPTCRLCTWCGCEKITSSMDFRIFHVVPMKVQCSMVRFLWFLVLSFFRPGLQLHKQTRLCKFFTMGACTRGEKCAFAHGPEHLRIWDLENLEKTGANNSYRMLQDVAAINWVGKLIYNYSRKKLPRIYRYNLYTIDVYYIPWGSMHAYRCKMDMYAMNVCNILTTCFYCWYYFWTLSDKPCRNPIFVGTIVGTMDIVHGLNRTQTHCIQLERDKPWHTVTISHFPS